MANTEPIDMSERRLTPPTLETFPEYKETFADVVDQLGHLKRMTERYPVYLVLAGKAYRFDGPADVDRFVAQLKQEISRFERAHQVRPSGAATT